MVPSFPLLSCESSVPVKKTLIEKTKNNPYELFQLRIGYICRFEPNTELSRPPYQKNVISVEK